MEQRAEVSPEAVVSVDEVVFNRRQEQKSGRWRWESQAVWGISSVSHVPKLLGPQLNITEGVAG